MKLQLNRDFIRRPAALVSAGALLLAGIAPAFTHSIVSADGQVTVRSVRVSNATPSATAVSYEVTFTPATSVSPTPEMIIDFCSNSPVIGDACTATAGTDVPNFSAATSTWGTLTAIGGGRGVKLTAGTNLVAATPVTVTLGAVVNPSNAPASFYARILTYNSGGAGANTSASPGTYRDYGGVALSSVQNLSITAKVMETLTFCASATSLAATSCASASSTAGLLIGHTVGTNTILDDGAVDVLNVYTKTSTNAASGVKVALKNTVTSATCAGLSKDLGVNCGIPAVASGATTPTAIAAGTAAIGMCVTPGSANTTATLPYNNGGCTLYGFDDTSATKITSTYGSQIFSSTGALNAEDDTLKFAATASNTTPAGIYTANYSLIATGTF